MLLLSSATRILATELPPRAPTHKRIAVLAQQAYSVIGASGEGGVNANCPVVCRKGNTATGTGSCRRFYRKICVRRPIEGVFGYQGMIFFNPFFFLLEDSFFGSLVALSAGLALGSAVWLASLPFPLAFGVPLSADGGLVEPESLAGVAALFGSVAGASVPPPVSPASTVEPLVAPDWGVATAITAVLPGVLLPVPLP